MGTELARLTEIPPRLHDPRSWVTGRTGLGISDVNVNATKIKGFSGIMHGDKTYTTFCL